MTISPPAALVGAQTPRISNVPTYVSSGGQEAVELADAAGLHLDPWQAHVLRESCGERADGKWAAFEVGLIVPRQNGKGSILEARELAGLFLFGEKLILHSAHEFKTAQEAFRRVLSLIQSTPSMEKRIARVRTSHGEEGVELTNGARLRFVARSTGSGRGFTGDCVILDEAYNLSGEAMAALLPTLSAVPNPQIWYTSSAGMQSSDQLRRLRERGMEGSSARLAYFEWSCDPADSLDDPASWVRANPSLGYRITDEFVRSEREAMPDREFARERLGVWFDDRTDAVIDAETWTALVDTDSSMLDPVTFAVDAAPDRTSAAIAVCGARGDGLTHVEIVDHRNGTGWVVARIADLYQRWQPAAVVLDPGSAAGALIPALSTAGIEPHLTSAREVAQSCGAFYDAVVEQKSLRHIDQPMLNEALAGAKKRPLGDAWAWSRKDSMTDIAPLVAATLAHHGHAVNAQADYDLLSSVW